MAGIRRVVDYLTAKLLLLAALAAAVMMLHVCADVFSKFVLRQPIIGTLETVSLFYMVTVVFLPLAAVQRDRENVFVELFTQNLSKRKQRLLDAFALFLTLVLALLFFSKGLETAMAKTAVRELSTNLEFQVQVWPGRWLPVIGFGSVALWCLVQIVDDLIFVVVGRSSDCNGEGTRDES